MNSQYSLHYYNSHVLLIVNSHGIIRMLYTPFMVKCIQATDGIPEGATIYVEEVFCNEQDELKYMVMGNVYDYRHFQLVSDF